MQLQLRSCPKRLLRPEWNELGQRASADVSSILDLATENRGTLSVWLGGATCRWLTFKRPKGISSYAQLRGIAHQLFADRQSVKPDSWRVEVCARPNGVIAVATRHELLTKIEDACTQHRIQIRHIRPWLTHVVDEGRTSLKKEKRVIGVIESDSVSLIDFRPASFKIMSLAAPAGEKDAVLQRLALQAGLQDSYPVLSPRKHDAQNVVNRREDFADLLSLGEN